MATLSKFLRRYTDIPTLVYMLAEQKITLLDPETWDDKNDSYFLKLYKEKNGFRSVLALCFTRNTETYHHWRVFANGASGVCITFKREALLRAVRKQSGIRTGLVKYLKLPEIRKLGFAAKSLPFLKRYPFEQENEYRVIYHSMIELPSLSIPFPLSCIDRITLSPWLHPSLSSHIKKMLWSIKGCKELEIVRSTLISNEEWKMFGNSAAK